MTGPERSQQGAASRSGIHPLRSPGIVATQLPGRPSATLPTLGPLATPGAEQGLEP